LQIRPGSVLIANPAYAHKEHKGYIVYITESSSASTMGVVLNSPTEYTMRRLLEPRGIVWPWDTTVSTGGEYNPHSLLMLHTDEWFSQNTMNVDNTFAISSDGFMLEKLEDGNAPYWFRIFLGCKGWSPSDLEHELRGAQAKWLLLARPSLELIHAAPFKMWNMAVEELSQDVFDSYF
jgi:putative transcriptional regulator